MEGNKIRCFINKIEYPLLTPLTITDHVAAADTSSVHVDIHGLPEPQALDTLYLFDGNGYLLFGGVIGSPQSPAYEAYSNITDYTLEVTNMAALLSRRYVNKAWTNSNVYEIVAEIYDRILSAENISLGSISPALRDLPDTTYIAPDMTASDVLTELANLVGAVWSIDANPNSTLREYLGEASSSLSFYAGESGPFPAITPFEFYDTPIFRPFVFRFVVPEDFPVRRPPRMWDLQKTVESYNLRTVQTMTGATGTTDPQTETFTYAADENKITVNWPVVELPSITVNGTPSPVGVNGIDSSNSTKQWLFSYNSPDIQLNQNYEPKLTGGETIVVTYRGFFQLRVRLENTQALEEIKAKSNTSGMMETVETNDRIDSAAGLIDYAVTQLYGNSVPEEQIQCSIDHWEDAAPLTIWKLDLPGAHISGEYTIVDRVLNVDGPAWTRVTLKSAGLLTSYGQTLVNYINNPTSIRDTQVVISAATITNDVTISASGRVFSPLVCYADDEQPWIWGGDYYAGY